MGSNPIADKLVAAACIALGTLAWCHCRGRGLSAVALLVTHDNGTSSSKSVRRVSFDCVNSSVYIYIYIYM